MNLAQLQTARPRPMPEFERPEFGPRALEDMADHEHRAALEQMFFHDLLNTLSGLHGYLQVWGDLSQEKARQLSEARTRRP